jgi:hypothetical protein
VITGAKDGKLEGTIDGEALLGFWDERSKKITFMRGSNIRTLQAWTGYLFENAKDQKVQYTLAGTFQSFTRENGGTPERHTHGWYAQILKEKE